jgi:V/A-type H+/Na+-transporting ATPase subunit D
VTGVRLTKNELKGQKDSLRMFQRYLPTLQLKKQQLQAEVRAADERLRGLAAAREALERELAAWVAVFGEAEALQGPARLPAPRVRSLRLARGNVAGVAIPVFDGADLDAAVPDLFAAPLWVDAAQEGMRRALLIDLEARVVEEQARLLSAELRTTTQRVNLFEKVKIPECEQAIKAIRIFLGDQQTAQVVRGKIAKRKAEDGER